MSTEQYWRKVQSLEVCDLESCDCPGRSECSFIAFEVCFSCPVSFYFLAALSIFIGKLITRELYSCSANLKQLCLMETRITLTQQ
jgi:hypothetical protein